MARKSRREAAGRVRRLERRGMGALRDGKGIVNNRFFANSPQMRFMRAGTTGPQNSFGRSRPATLFRSPVSDGNLPPAWAQALLLQPQALFWQSFPANFLKPRSGETFGTHCDDDLPIESRRDSLVARELLDSICFRPLDEVTTWLPTNIPPMLPDRRSPLPCGSPQPTVRRSWGVRPIFPRFWN